MDFEVTVIRESVQFGFRDDLSCSNCKQDLDLITGKFSLL